MLALGNRRDAAHLIARLLDRHALFQPREYFHRPRRAIREDVETLTGRLANHRPRYVECRSEKRIDAGEPLRRHADDGELGTVEANRIADRVGAGAEFAPPRRVAQ